MTSATSTRTTRAEHPLLGDARLVLRQFIEAVKALGGRPAGREKVRAELERVRAAWLAEWTPTLGSAEGPDQPLSGHR